MLELRTELSEGDFVEQFVSKNQPVVVRGSEKRLEGWTPGAISDSIGELTTQVYGSLFDLEDILPLADYIDEFFGVEGPYADDVPYVRWYSQLRDVDFPWSDEAFQILSGCWKKPDFLPSRDLLVPQAQAQGADPVVDRFPYRGILVAARGARTRLHRDPFGTDAVVYQLHGVKDVALYHPDRTEELREESDGSSFGGFVDVRGANLGRLNPEPDHRCELSAGDQVYIPHGWLHDVIVEQDSISLTWNFVHARGADGLIRYLEGAPEQDPEFEVLQYFQLLGGHPNATPADILARCESAVTEGSSSGAKG